MGRTIPTYRLHLESILNDWMDYRRALREKDREAFDRLVAKARQHASAASFAAHLDPTALAILSILLETEKEIGAAKDMGMHMHTQDEMAKNIAVADDVYAMLSKEKREGESFSDVIRRLGKRRKSLLEFAGAWADIPDEEFREMEAAWAWANQPLEEALGRRGKRVEGP
ncbi:MAG: hypothetical protein A3K59_09430 [Euryarchaeota archaeon RBG_19FT_COMBO_69_17]|nr:MAG: hypothetical protein A3K59_09430 [Euryarchaeota archaeon RBG_19FT_COMBO_69_17]